MNLKLEADEGGSVTLHLRCESNKTEAYLDWDDFMDLDASQVTVRLGAQSAQTQAWPVSTDRKATFYPGRSIGFIKKLLEVDRLVVQATPYGENPVTAIFDVQGLDVAVPPLRETCGW